ncbi:MAG: RluA family pseudouridine synthase [Chloroflexi bacterium]|nr:RluA family pseudouridine synthase [Chloroflexota bacterium]
MSPARPREAEGPRVAPHVPNGQGVEVGVLQEASGLRLDAFLARVVGHRSRSEWARLVDLGAVLQRGRPSKAGARVATGDVVTVLDVPSHRQPLPEADIPLDIIYEDRLTIVVNKPAGLVVHPAPGHEEGTLVNALLARFPELRDPTGELRPGIVHRLDKDTSGLLVIGRTQAAVADLQAQFKSRSVDKRYLALVHGGIADDEGLIDAPIGRDPRNRQKMAVRADGREAQTRFWSVERLGEMTLLEVQLLTGRTHQIRVHCAFIGHPVAGDTVYGRKKPPSGLKRQFLHAWKLDLRSPADGLVHRFEADLPDELQLVLERLRSADWAASGQTVRLLDDQWAEEAR